MSKIISVHEYVLKPGVDEIQFQKAIMAARKNSLVKLPGLSEVYFVKGRKGARKGFYAAIWVYESLEAWEALWGTPENPRSKQDYPANWQAWEDEVLAPFLIDDPDRIEYTAYEELT